MREARLEELEMYISRRHNTVCQYIATRTSLDLCLEVNRRPVARETQMWWKQEGINFTGAGGGVDAEETGETEMQGDEKIGNNERTQYSTSIS